MFRQSAIILVVFCVLVVVAAALLPGCGSSATAVPNPQTTIAAPATTTTAPSTQKPSEPSTSVPPSTPAMNIKTEVVYFHLTARCVTCLCFEKNIKYVVDAFYKDAIRDGKMTFSIINAQDKQNADIVKKYKAVGSQLFVNTVVNGIDHIKDIQAIWEWNCTKDTDGFNRRVKIVFDRSLQGEY